MWNRTENQIKLVMIRHGATASNKERRYLGRSDEALSEEGRNELYRAKKEHIYPKAEYVFSSPMKRCLETAAILYPAQEPIMIPQWKEIDFGAFEGKNYIELQEDARYQAWINSNGTLPFPEGESREQFAERCVQGFLSMQKQLSERTDGKETGAIGVIVHGGTIMSLLSRFHGGKYFDYQVPNAGGYVCTVKSNRTGTEMIDLVRLDL